MATIDLSNYDLLLVQSTTSRTGGANAAVTGNIRFDTANGRIELITAEEKAFVDLTSKGTGTPNVVATALVASSWYTITAVGTTDFTLVGAASNTVGVQFQASGAGTGTGTANLMTANPLSNQDGIKLEALYAFERQERRIDENLRKYDYYFTGTFKFGGAYELVNNRKFDDADGGTFSTTTDDRRKIRGSGWIERNVAGAIGRIYYGVVSLGTIQGSSQPYYQLSAGGAPVNFGKAGGINEAVQVYGNATIDPNTTTFDTRTYLANKVRTYGYNYDTKILADSGVSEMGGYSSGFALGESIHLTTNTTDMPLASVYNAVPASQTGVWLNMTLEELDTPQLETGFTTADGNFTWVLNNPNNASLNQCIAYLDAIAQTDNDINAHATNVTNGKRVGTWYSYNAAGKILPKVGTGAAGEGLFIEGLVGTDKNRVIFTDDAGATKEYPAYSNVAVTVGAGAVADTNAWFHSYFLTAFNTAGAVTVENAQAATVKGNVAASGLRVGNDIVFEFDWVGDTLGGTAGTNKDVVFECEGDGGVTAAKTVFTLTSAASITASCVPLAESNV